MEATLRSPVGSCSIPEVDTVGSGGRVGGRDIYRLCLVLLRLAKLEDGMW